MERSYEHSKLLHIVKDYDKNINNLHMLLFVSHCIRGLMYIIPFTFSKQSFWYDSSHFTEEKIEDQDFPKLMVSKDYALKQYVIKSW